MIKKLGVFRTILYQHNLRILTRSEDAKTAQAALEEIIAVLMTQEDITRTLSAYDATPGDIRGLYQFLLHHGADIWVHGNYVAAHSLGNPVILEAYLRDRHLRDDRGYALAFADTCVRYVEGGYADQFLRDNLDVFTPRQLRA
jgi:hypothetical protein